MSKIPYKFIFIAAMLSCIAACTPVKETYSEDDIDISQDKELCAKQPESIVCNE